MSPIVLLGPPLRNTISRNLGSTGEKKVDPVLLGVRLDGNGRSSLQSFGLPQEAEHHEQRVLEPASSLRSALQGFLLSNLTTISERACLIWVAPKIRGLSPLKQLEAHPERTEGFAA